MKKTETIVRFFYESVYAYLVNLVVWPFVIMKWRRDGRVLPLTKSHWKLYLIIHQHMARKLFRFPDLISGESFNDKIQWLKLFDQDDLKIKCSDKVAVRDFVRDRVGDKYLTKLYQVADRVCDVDVNSLPASFVMKTNHDSGTVVIVRDKNNFKFSKAFRKLDKSMGRRYGWNVGEWAYRYIQPKILVEEYIDGGVDSCPPDYKFYCVEGRVRFCHYIYGRGVCPKEQLVDATGGDIGIELHPKFNLGDKFVKPHTWDEMKAVAEALSLGFKCVRVDLYATQGRIYFGEMTFWPMAGCYRGSEDSQKYYGMALDFDRSTFQSPVIQ